MYKHYVCTVCMSAVLGTQNVKMNTENNYGRERAVLLADGKVSVSG